MAITPTIVRLESGAWEFTWTPGTAPYQVWLDGVLLDSPTTPTYEYAEGGYEDTPPDLEILNAGEESEGATNPPYLQLQWRGVQGAFAYVVEEFVGAAWVLRETLLESAVGYYLWRSPRRDNEEAVQYRVRAIDSVGVGGAVLAFSTVVYCHPAPPEVSFGISSSGDVEVSSG